MTRIVVELPFPSVFVTHITTTAVFSFHYFHFHSSLSIGERLSSSRRGFDEEKFRVSLEFNDARLQNSADFMSVEKKPLSKDQSAEREAIRS